MAVWMVLLCLAAPERAPRLSLAATRTPRRELQLRLVNDSLRPVEVGLPLAVVPEVSDAAGRRIVFSDWRNAAGYAPPEPPAPPAPPLRPGAALRLATYPIRRAGHGWVLVGPYGQAALAPGRYRVKVAFEVAPMTRAAWVAAFQAAPSRRGADAEREAERYARHWQEVDGYWRGHLESNAVDLELP